MRASVRLRHLAQINPPTPGFDKLPADAEVTFLPLEAVWSGAQLDTTRVCLKSEVATGYTRFCEGDVLIPKITPTFEADRSAVVVGLRGGVGAGTTELHVIRPNPGTDRRYVKYLVSSRSFLLGGEAGMIGVAGQKRVPDSWLRNFPVHVTAKVRQVAIADFLDIETARIDTLIAKKRQMLQLLAERSAGIVERDVRDLAERHGERQRLKTMVKEITVGIVVKPSVWYSDRGVPALRGLNVRPHRIDLADLVKLSAEGHRVHAKSMLRAGDVVVVRTGQAGAAAVVPPELDCTNCIDLLIVRPGSLDANFLAYVLNSDWTHKHINKYSVGTIQSHFNVSSLAELPIPAAPLDEQRRFVLHIDVQLARLNATQEKLSDQLELLREHRQALVTAAVAGEIDVPGVST